MAVRSLLSIHACEHDLRADTKRELDAAIKRLTSYSSDVVMAPLKMLNGKWRAIVRGPTVIFSADFDADLVDRETVRGVRHVDALDGGKGEDGND